MTSNEGEGGNGVRRDSGSKGYLVYCVSAPIVREIMSCVGCCSQIILGWHYFMVG